MGRILTPPFIPDGLVGKWMLGDGHPLAQRGTVIDLSGRSHPGVIHGVPALYFDHSGSDKYVSPGTCFPWMQGHRYAAIRFVVKPSATGGGQMIYREMGSAGEMLRILITGDDGAMRIYADTTGDGSGALRNAVVAAGAITMDAFNYGLAVVDATDDKLYVWINGAVVSDGIAFSGAFAHDTFQTGTPTAQRWGLSTSDTEPLEGYLCCMGVAGLDSLPTLANAKGIYDNPQGSLNGAGITWDAWYRCNENANPADNGQGDAARDLTTTTAAWDVGANLGNAWTDSGGIGNGDSFSGGKRYFDGVQDLVSIADPADLRFGTADFQIHVWAAPTGTQDEGIIGKGGFGTGKWYIRHVVVGDKIQFNGNSSDLLMDGTWTPDGATHLFSVILDIAGDVCRIYVDGVQKGTTSTNVGVDLNTTEDVTLGTRAVGDTQWLKGGLSQALIATATKTVAKAEADMQAMYAKERSLFV